MTPGVEALRQALPGYEVAEEIGRGGFGVVWAAVHLQLGRAVAVKQLAPELAADPDVRRRFRAEARVVASLDHPHIVPVYDYVEHDGLCLLVMERLPGGTVRTRHRAGGLSPEGACAVAVAAASGLHHAHRRGVLHRDVKPDNLMIAGSGIVKVADFGIARVVAGTESLMTRTGSILGTPAYMAPEQVLGAALGPPADVYALGVVLYELLAHRLPFSEDGGAMAVLYRRVNDDPMTIGDACPALPASVADVVMRALARDPLDRFPSTAAFVADLMAAADAAWGQDWLSRAELPVVVPPPSDEATAVPIPTAVAPPSAAEPSPVGRRGDSAGWSALRTAGSVPRAVVATVALFLTAVAVAVSSAGAPGYAHPLARGAGTLAGADLAGGVRTVDLSRPVELVLRRLPAELPDVTAARLRLVVGGVTVGSAVSDLDGPTRELRAFLDARASRYVAVGRLTAAVDLVADGRVVLTQEVAVRASRSSLASVPGALALVVAAIVMAYAESLLRPLRRGRRRLGSFVGMSLVGGGTGVLLAAAVWMSGLAELVVPAAAATAVLAAGAGVMLAVATARVGAARRVAAAPATS